MGLADAPEVAVWPLTAHCIYVSCERVNAPGSRCSGPSSAGPPAPREEQRRAAQAGGNGAPAYTVEA